MYRFKPLHKHRVLLNYFAEYNRPKMKEIARCLECSLAAMYKKINTLEKHGYISVDRRCKPLGIVLTQKGYVQVLKLLNKTTTHSYEVEKGDIVDLHNLRFTFKIGSWSSDDVLTFGWKRHAEWILRQKTVKCTHNEPTSSIYFPYGLHTVRVTPRKLIVKMSPIDASDPTLAKQVAVEYLNEIIERMEKLFNMSLIKPGKLSVYVSSQHIAFVGNTFASWFATMGYKCEIYDKETGKLRVVVDNSHGKPELEFVHPSKAEDDAENFYQFQQDIRPANMKKMIERIAVGDFLDVPERLAELDQRTLGIEENLINLNKKVDEILAKLNNNH